MYYQFLLADLGCLFLGLNLYLKLKINLIYYVQIYLKIKLAKIINLPLQNIIFWLLKLSFSFIMFTTQIIII